MPPALESPSAELAPTGALGETGTSYVTSPKVLELEEPDTAKRVALGWLGLIVAAGLVLRLLLFALGPAAGAERAMTDDSGLRAHLAGNLLTEQTFGYDAADTALTGGGLRADTIELRSSVGQLEATVNGLQPEVFELPGYAIALGLVDAAGGPTAWLLILQCVLAAASAALVYGIIYNLLGKHGPGLVAAAIVAIHPALIIAPLSLTDDVLFSALLLVGLYGASRRTTPMAIIGGLALSAAVLVRPISIFVGPAIALWMVLGDRKASTLGCAVTVAAMSVAGPAMWMARNHMNGFGLRTSSAPAAALAQTAAQVSAEAAGIDAPARDTLPSSVLTGGDVLSSLSSGSRQAILDHPEAFGIVMSRTALHLLTDHRVDALYGAMGLSYEGGGAADAFRTGEVIVPPPSPETRAIGGISAGWLAINALLVLGAVLGMATMAGRRQGALLLLVAAGLAYFTFLATGFGPAAWQPVALVFAAMACGAVFARSPKRFKEPKVKKPKRSRKQKRQDQVFDMDSHLEDLKLPEEREGLAARPI